MPPIERTALGMPNWVDAVVETSEQREGLMAFYNALFGWTYDVSDDTMGHYTIASLNGQAAMGFGQGPGGAGEVTTYFATDDVAASVEKAVALGGHVGMGPTHVGDVGEMAIVLDSVGARHGLWRPGTFEGFGVVYEPGASGWFDHSSSDPDAAAQYYRDLTGMSLLEPDPEMKVLANGEQWFASFSVDRMGGRPAQWNAIYVADSLERVRDTVRTQGGVVLVEEMPVPGSAITVFAEPVMNQVVTVMRAGQHPDEG